MNEKQFEELLLEVQDKNIWDLRKREVKQILKELLDTEFKGVRERRFKVVLKRLDRAIGGAFSKNGKAYIFVDMSHWERNPRFSELGLKAVLRHELLHIETGLPDHDLRFKVAARQRNIDIWHY